MDEKELIEAIKNIYGVKKVTLSRQIVITVIVYGDEYNEATAIWTNEEAMKNDPECILKMIKEDVNEKINYFSLA